jgi:hypothetical protein
VSTSEKEIARDKLERWEAVTAFNRPVFEAYDEIAAAVRFNAGAAAATLFARPIVGEQEIAWTTDLDGPIRAWTKLDAAEHERLEPLRQSAGAQLKNLVSTLRQAGINTRQGNLAHLIESALVIPGPDHLHVAGDRLLLTFWGFRTPGRPGVDPFAADLPPPVLPAPPISQRKLWPFLLGLFVLLILIVPFWWLHRTPSTPPISMPPAPIAAAPKLEPPSEPKPEAPAHAEMPPPPQQPHAEATPPPPAPAKPVDLPQDAWSKHDLSVLKGCWVLGKPVEAALYSNFGIQTESGITQAARLCFDETGNGHETELSDFPSGRLTCQARITATFSSKDELIFQRPRGVCRPRAVFWMRARATCTRQNDEVAECIQIDEKSTAHVEFRRAR